MKAKLSNFVAIDAGSNKIAGIAASIDKKGNARIVSQNLHYSSGFKSGVITHLKNAENSIISAIYSLERDCGKNIKQVVVSLSGAGTKSYYVYHKIKLSNQQISKQDVKKLIQKALAEFKVKDQEIIHYFPVEFSIDDNTNIDYPVGMLGKELGCQLHIITANTALLANLANCFAKCHVEINSLVLAIYASGLSCLSDDEKNLGSIIIDIGSSTTSFGVFLSGKLIYTDYIPIGSSHITSDIAKIFSISFNLAEKLKVLYGNAIPSSFDKNNIINVDDLEPDSLYNSTTVVTSSQLTEVINPRVEEMLLMIKEQYDKIAVDHLIARRLVITGGGSMLRGIKELASNIFEKQVRIAKPNVIPGFAEDCNPGIYSTSLGMVKDYVLKQQKQSFEVDSKEEGYGWVKKTLAWLKDNI